MSADKLSPAALAICASNIGKNYAGCGKCVIRAECYSGPTKNLSHESLSEWRQQVNAAAARATESETS